MADDEDEALSWGDERDATHVDATTARAPSAPRTTRAERRALAADAPDASDQDAVEVAPANSALLVILGVLGGVYLLYTVGWVITAQHTVTTQAPPLELFALSVKKVLAIAASVLWFAATLWLTRGRRPIVRIGWLVIGALVLVPWPFVFGISGRG